MEKGFLIFIAKFVIFIMPVQKPTQTLNALQKGSYSPVYFLHGSEPYYTSLISHYIATHALPENEKSFNQLVLYGRDTTMGEIVNQARRFPMMTARQVVIVKELQELPDLRNEAAQSLLQKYVAQPLPSTILVLCYQHKPFDKRKALYKTLEKHAVIVE
ncbi:MAG: DNA polymerase III subunit delta, partial [Bacteroidota bacterium]